MRRLALLLALAALPAGPAGAQQGGYPQLRPVEELLARQGGALLAPEGAEALSARAAGLAARAAALRRLEVIDAATRARFAALRDRAGG